MKISHTVRLLFACVLLIQLAPAGQRVITAAHQVPVPDTFWGMHMHHSGQAWPAVCGSDAVCPDDVRAITSGHRSGLVGGGRRDANDQCGDT